MPINTRWTMSTAIMTVVAAVTVSVLASSPATAAETTSTQRSADAAAITVAAPALPYHYYASQSFYPNDDAPELEPFQSKLHVELPESFSAAAPGDVSWTFAGVSGSATVALDTVDIDLPGTIASISAGRSELDLHLHTATVSPTEAPRPPERYRGQTPSWEADAFITIGVDQSLPVSTPADPGADTLDVSLADYLGGHVAQNTYFWATAPSSSMVTASTAVTFTTESPLWADDDVRGLYGALSWADVSPLPGNQPMFFPTFSDDRHSATVDFSDHPELLRPYLVETGRAVISVGKADQFEAVVVSMATRIGSDTSIAGIQTTRLSAPDRYQTAMLTSQFAYPDGASTLYIASGANFPDALSAGAAAVANSAPLLLALPGTYLDPDYVSRLHPTQIVVVGGPDSVSDWQVETTITQAGLDPAQITVRRDGGADRYAASRAVATAEYPNGADTVFLATGATFPDALSSVSAASTVDAPVVLIRGDQPSLDDATRHLLGSLGVKHVVVTGGPASISTGIERQLDALYPGAVVRFGGANRYEVSNAVNSAYFPEASGVYFATGEGFADALTGGVLAGATGSPLLLSHGDCVEASTIEVLRAEGVSDVTLIGGVQSLRPPVQALTTCG